MNDNPNIHKITLENKEVLLIGTAHVSQKSADDVEYAVDEFKPDTIGIELDPKRLKIIKGLDEKNTDFTIEKLINMITSGKLPEYILTLILSIPQNRLSEKLNIKPGAEMLKGVELSEKLDINLLTLDRDFRITLTRIVNSIPFWMWPLLGISSLFSLIALEFISEDDIETLRGGEGLKQATESMSTVLPDLKKVLIDERDMIISKNILDAESEKIVAIIGAGHIEGVTKYLNEGINEKDIEEFNTTPETNPFKIF